MKNVLFLFIVLATSLVAQDQPVMFEKELLLRPDYIPVMGEVSGETHYIEYNETYHAYGYKTSQGGFVFYEPVVSDVPITVEKVDPVNEADEASESDEEGGSPIPPFLFGILTGVVVLMFLILIFGL